ncbi:MAG: GHKL domain-containing protein [Bacteroidetes bacterium]|nr:GHKL domain-containing protein [Bacteroidota bacterium]
MRYFFFVVALLLPWCTLAQHALPISRTYENQHGELGRSVWGIIQDKRGILYLATDLGVVEYDGVNFRQLDTPPAYGIITDSTGVIYVSCKDEFGQLIYDAHGVVHFKSLFRFDESVYKFEEVNLIISPKKVSAISYRAVLEYDRKKNTGFVYYTEPGRLFSNGFFQHDTTFVSMISHGLYYLHDGKIIQAPYGDQFKLIHEGKMNANLDLNKKQRLVVFGSTLMKYFGKDAPPIPFKLSSNYLEGSFLYSAFAVNDREKVLTTINKGAILFDTSGTVINIYNEQRRLPGTAIPSGLADKSGNIWFTFEFNKAPLVKTEAGHDIKVWNEYVGMKGNVLHISQIAGKTLIGTGLNLYSIEDDDRVISYFSPGSYFVTKWLEYQNKESRSRILGILSGQDVVEYRDGKLKVIYKSRDWSDAIQSKIFSNRLYVIEGERLGYMSHINNSWRYIELTRISHYKSFVEDGEGALWLISEKKDSVARVTPTLNENSKKSPIRFFTLGKEIQEPIGSTFVLDGQPLFVGVKNIFTFDKLTNMFAVWRAARKLKNLLLHATVLQTDTLNDMIHLVSDNKLVSVSKDKLGDTVYITNPYQRFENIGVIVGLSVDGQGNLWVAGNDGVIRYDKTKDRKNYDQEFQCLIRSVVMGEDSVLMAGGLEGYKIGDLKIRLPFNFDKLSISYAAPFFDKEEEMLYSHWLIGRDKHWSEWGKSRVKEYNDLLEGTYTFKVKARNVYGKESTVSEVTFTIKPPWYRTWWIYIAYFLGFVLLITAAWRWRTRSLRTRQRELEQLVAIRTNELVRVNNDLHTSHQQLLDANKELEASQEELRQGNEELGATNEYLKRMQKQLVENEKMASLGQLTAGIAHEINNPINFISGGVQALEEIQREVFDGRDMLAPEEIQERKKEISELIKSINNGVVRTSNIVKSLRTFSSPIESIDERGTVDVRECIQDAITLVRNKVQKANVTLVQNINHRYGAKANASLIAQVLINLLDNAIYALDKVLRERVITITTEETANEIIIKVSDNADGIEQSVLARIFDPFFTTKEVGAGTGLGLWISYSIIEKHAGNILVKSELGKGTEFTISLPIGSPLQI